MCIILELCVDSVAGAITAQAGGANGIALRRALDEDGLTPSIELLRVVRCGVGLTVHAMIRPRSWELQLRGL